MLDNNTKITIIGLDGKVRSVPSYMKDELLKKGWRIVINPKREYYFEFDQSIKGNTTPTELENVSEVDVLPIERL